MERLVWAKISPCAEQIAGAGEGAAVVVQVQVEQVQLEQVRQDQE